MTGASQLPTPLAGWDVAARSGRTDSPPGRLRRWATRAGGRHRAADLGMFLLASLSLVSDDTSLVHGWVGVPHGLRVADAVFGGIALAGIFWRRRYPVAYGLYVLPVACFASVAGLATLVATFTVAVHRRWQVAVPYAVASAATAFPAGLLYTDDDEYWTLMVASTATTLAFCGWGMYTRARRQLVESLRDRAHRAEAEQLLRADRARRDERQRIAREMHDVLAHRLSLLAVHAGALELRPDAPAEHVSRAAGVIRATAREALQELRDVVAVLRESTDPDVRERPQPTLEDLPALVAECRAAGSAVTATLRLPEGGAAVPVAAGRAVYRIVQESLTNARKHAPGSTVELAVTGSPGAGLGVVVRSRLAVGRLVDPMPGSGSGLVGLAERTALVGGRLQAAPEAGDFVVRAWLPWSGDAQGGGNRYGSGGTDEAEIAHGPDGART